MKYNAHILLPSHFHIRDGKSQAKRALPALEKDYFNVADLRFHALLAKVVDYTELMTFYDHQNRPNGNWKPFFSLDETVVMASILATDPDKLVALLNQTHDLSDSDEELIVTLNEELPENIRHLTISACMVLRMLDDWFVRLASARSEAGVQLHKLTESVLVGLKKDLNWFLHDLKSFVPVFSVEEIVSQDLADQILAVQDDHLAPQNESVTEALDEVAVRSFSYALIKAVEMIQESAAELLPISLTNKQHDPAVGLLIAFLQLFHKVHHKINKFTLNYIDFYYDQVLKTQPRQYEPDSAYLTVNCGNNVHELLLPKGTEFLAGKDENKQDIIFTATEAVQINQAAVRAVHTLFFNRDILSSPESQIQERVVLSAKPDQQPKQLVTGCWQNEIPAFTNSELADSDLMRLGKVKSFPLFGAPRTVEEPMLTKHARIGFALASKVLFLQEGQRTVRIIFKYNDDQLEGDKNKRTLHEWIKEIAFHLKDAKDDKTVTQTDEQVAFLKVFRDAFKISVSTAQGWLEISEYLPSYKAFDDRLEKNSLSITFSLSADVPPICAYDEVIHGEGYSTRLPVIKFIINPKGYLYSYGVLRKLELLWVRIDVDVEGCRALQLYNNIGQLSPQAPFTPFGPMPEIGSYLIVGCAEVAGKQLTSFNLDVKWGGLPSEIGGLRAHYQGYGKAIDNSDYQVSTSVLVNGKWLPENSNVSLTTNLFQLKSDLDVGEQISETRNLSCDPVMIYWTPLDYRTQEMEYAYTPSSNKGFFKFTLSAPVGAFGHKDYPNILAEVLTHNARQKIQRMTKQIPNAPYTPTIDSISANYQAFVNITPNNEEVNCLPLMQEKLIHLHPFGWKDSGLDADLHFYLLPQYSDAGNLLIGLEGVAKEKSITLYFNLRENSLPAAHNHQEKLEWFYLVADQWVALGQKEVVSDSTHGFMTSGIVTLNVPHDITAENMIMPGELFWFRVAANHDLEKFCSVISIHAQALKVVRYVDEQTVLGHLKKLPAGNIFQTKSTVPGLEVIQQVRPSFGGRSQEDRAYLRIRVSERLRHKKRALLPEDYELLILEQFPQIYKVKCFPNVRPDTVLEKRICPGQLLIVALPYLTKETKDIHRPLLSGNIVNEIKEFVTRLAPPFVSIHIANPVYEVVQVRCTVKFKSTIHSGRYVNQLNQAISEYLSPWNDTIGYTEHFGWAISGHDIESFIHQLSYIDRVTNFSILRIAPEQNDTFDLYDSAAYLNHYTVLKEIFPKYPWSVMSPIKQHFIEVDDRFDLIKPEITGVGELEIGSTFIVTEEKWREKIERH